MRRTELPGGGRMSVSTVCLGWHWSPYRYTRTAVDVNDAPVAPVPAWLADLGRRAVAAAYPDPGVADGYDPDTVLINFYTGDARMGMHQDKDERTDARTHRSSRSASATPARSVSATPGTGAGPTPTCGSSRATCSSSAARPASRITVFRESFRVPATGEPGCRAVAST